MSHNIPNIPFDIIASEILHRLDLRTLVQCTCVCKQWNSLIASPSFISYHSIQNSKYSSHDTTTEPLLFQICRKESYSVSVRKSVSIHPEINYSLHSDNRQIDLLRALKDPPLDRFKKKDSFLKVLGTCNGLVCLFDALLFPETLILWNPILQKYVLLPRLNSNFIERISLGFGFDSRNNDFKVVKLVNEFKKLSWAWVCSFGTRSWKSIPTDTCSQYFVREGKNHVFMNGVLHWVAKHRKMHYSFVLTFDLAEEAFGEILLPQMISEEWCMALISLYEIKDSLAASYVNEGAPDHCLCAWIMKKYGVVESWTKVATIDLRNIELQLNPKNVLLLRKNGDMILETKDGKILSYNPTTATTEDLGVRGDHVFIGYHKESLFLLDKREGVKLYKY